MCLTFYIPRIQHVYYIHGDHLYIYTIDVFILVQHVLRDADTILFNLRGRHQDYRGAVISNIRITRKYPQIYQYKFQAAVVGMTDRYLLDLYPGIERVLNIET